MRPPWPACWPIWGSPNRIGDEAGRDCGRPGFLHGRSGPAGIEPVLAAAELAEMILSRMDLRRRDVEECVAECGEGREAALGGAVSV